MSRDRPDPSPFEPGSGASEPAPRPIPDGDVRVALGLGSNLGDRLENLRRAVGALSEAGRLEGVSSVYETPPAGYADQPDFLNMVVLLRTSHAPRRLLEFLEGVEAEAGRKRSFRNAPRTLDIDIILYGREVVRQTGLTVPHPRWKERSFVVVPLREVAPEWRDPESGRTVSEVAQGGIGGTQEIRRVAPPPAPEGPPEIPEEGA